MLTKDLNLPTDEELTVPQEITLSTPWLRAVAPYMARSCETQIKEFMLRRKELEDPRKTLKEGAAVTACGVSFLRALKKTCRPEAEKFADCIDHGNRDLHIGCCREEQLFMDRCLEDKMGIVRPPLGHFAKIHIHDSPHSRPVVVQRDYKAEAARVLSELPPDTKLDKNYKNFSDWRIAWFKE
ncbi:NADH dehydrogenase [ubiquinone] 1 alpha subcomplex subunit 8 [Aphelenchoides besseyi]|nr:NADH dehydrogenase [ubiquinone] 1 alpha subcomplex subunit 8 [Aphelenchoides besseyi]